MARITRGTRASARLSNKTAQQDRKTMTLAKALAKVDSVIVANPSLNRFALLSDESENNFEDSKDTKDTLVSPTAVSVRPMSHKISWTCSCYTCSVATSARNERIICWERKKFQERRDATAAQTADIIREKDARIQHLTTRLSQADDNLDGALQDAWVVGDNYDDLRNGLHQEVLPYIESLEGVVVNRNEIIQQKTHQLEVAALAVREQWSRADAAEQIAVTKDAEISMLKQQLAQKNMIIEMNESKIKMQDEAILKAYRSEEGKYNVWHSRCCPTEERIRLLLFST